MPEPSPWIRVAELLPGCFSSEYDTSQLAIAALEAVTASDWWVDMNWSKGRGVWIVEIWRNPGGLPRGLGENADLPTAIAAALTTALEGATLES